MLNKTEKALFDQLKFRVFEESYPRIYKCLDELSLQQIWLRPSPNLSSIGHLILHLEGNARQWILSGLYGQKNVRKRDWEFSTEEILSQDDLMLRLETLKDDILTAIENKPFPDLDKTYHIQIFEESGVSVVVHVIEHFSYHTGQIAFFTKILTGDDLAFYGGMEL